MEAVAGRLASKAELKAHMQEVEAAHHHDSRYTAKVCHRHSELVDVDGVGISKPSAFVLSEQARPTLPSAVTSPRHTARVILRSAAAPCANGACTRCASRCSAVPLQLWHNDPATKLAGYTKSMRNMVGDDRRAHYGVSQSRRTQS